MTDQETCDDFGVLTEPTTLVIQRWLPGPVERLWAYLTEADLRRKWLADGELTPEPGAEGELVWRNDQLSGATGQRPEGFGAEHRMATRVIAAEPPHRLTFAWGEGDVTFLLEPRGERVRLTITHTGIEARDSRVMIGAGWHAHLDLLVALATGDTPPVFWSHWTKLRRDYDARLPA